MDVVTDLTARAVAFISLIQDISYIQNPREKKLIKEDVVLLDKSVDFEILLIQALQPEISNNKLVDLSRQRAANKFREQATELRRINDSTLQEGEEVWQSWIGQALELLKWLNDHETKINEKLSYFRTGPDALKVKPISPCEEDKQLADDKAEENNKPTEAISNRDPYPAPQQWRVAIRHVLYNFPDNRWSLVEAFDYLPVLVFLALDAEIPGSEKTGFRRKGDNRQQKDYQNAKELLENDRKLLEELREKEVPLPFKMVFQEELEEIQKRRYKTQGPFAIEEKDPGEKGC